MHTDYYIICHVQSTKCKCRTHTNTHRIKIEAAKGPGGLPPSPPPQVKGGGQGRSPSAKWGGTVRGERCVPLQMVYIGGGGTKGTRDGTEGKEGRIYNM